MNNGNNGEITKVEKTENGENKVNWFDKARNGWIRFKTGKVTRWAYRGAKAGLCGLGLFTAYNAGKKSVKPTTVYVDINSGATVEEPEPEQNENEETADEEAKPEE